MNNREIAGILSETARMMELHGVNEFKVKSLINAAFVISRLESPLSDFTTAQMEEIKGIGKSTSLRIAAILESGTLPEYQEYLATTPEGVVEMMRIKGIGPKKTALLWKDLGIENPGELLYACNENRLVELKGFGIKTQEQIRKAIEYALSHRGLFHYATLELPALALVEMLVKSGFFSRVSLTGDIRRKCEVLSCIEILCSGDELDPVYEKLKSVLPSGTSTFELKEERFHFQTAEGIPVVIECCEPNDFYYRLFITTSSDAHLEKIGNSLIRGNFNSEESIYDSMGMQFIEPELREGIDETELALNKRLPELLVESDLRGCLHNHSTWSDGLHSLREMALATRDAGLEYLGICDHSKSAFYANGLNAERVAQQHEEIDQLNKELFPFRIFKGIESDILQDGNLDYPDSVLRTFDFIVASVHSGLKMTEEKATERLIRAVSNPYTTILGHPTGRLLLARPGYPVDHKKVIDACAEHGVIIELNAHPYRLDLDWRWIRYALSKNVMISVNPDAHHTGGIHDMHYGVSVARKGGLTRLMTFNARTAEAIASHFTARRNAVSQQITT
jgi:DNA polymerase (family 10)